MTAAAKHEAALPGSGSEATSNQSFLGDQYLLAGVSKMCRDTFILIILDYIRHAWCFGSCFYVLPARILVRMRQVLPTPSYTPRCFTFGLLGTI